MKINDEGLALIKEFEGLRLEAYQDMAGIWTIGYGCTGGIKPGLIITEDEALRRLHSRLENLEKGLLRCVRVPLNSNEFSSLCSFAYNIGLHAFGTSTLLKKLNAECRKEASDQFLKWTKVKGQEIAGLMRRRIAERKLFLKPVSDA